MTNISEAFAHGKAFIPFLTCGDPDLETTEKLIPALAEAGADLIELGIPFSDPTAEGPVIQDANLRALSGGTTTDKIFDMVRRVRRKVSVPMIFRTYANVIFSYGPDRFLKTAAQIGISGIIVPDIPFEEREEFAPECRKYGLVQISTAAPNSHHRVHAIAEQAEGFLCCVSSSGMMETGSSTLPGIGAVMQHVRAVSDIPCVVKGGISTPEQAEAACRQSDGVIVGSAVVKLIAAHGRDCVPPVSAYVREMKAACRRAD